MDDYISREEVMSVIANMQVEHHYDAANLEDRYVVAHLLEVADRIKELKAANVQPVKHGKWEGYLCPECNENADYFISGNFYFDEEPNFCPNCGADMRDKKENENG
jgi:rubrerythrin